MLEAGYGLVKVNGRDLKEITAEKFFEKQKKKGEFFQGKIFNGKKALVVDDIQDVALNDKYLEICFSSSIKFYDIVIFFCSERDYFSNSIYSEHSEMEGYRIQDFGYVKRDELYSKWLSVGNPSIYTINNNEYHERVDIANPT